MWSLGFVNRCDRMVEDFRITMEPISINTLTAITAKHIFLVPTQGSTPSTVLHINTRHFYFCLIFDFFKIFVTKTALNLTHSPALWNGHLKYTVWREMHNASMQDSDIKKVTIKMSRKLSSQCLPFNPYTYLYKRTLGSKFTQDYIGIL